MSLSQSLFKLNYLTCYYLNCVDFCLNSSNSGNNNREKIISEASFATRAIHAGQEPSQCSHSPMIPPIYMSVTFPYNSVEDSTNYFYGRCGHPKRDCLESAIASLEQAEYAIAYASGLAAVVNVAHLLDAGDHIVISDDLYGGTTRYFTTVANRFRLNITTVDATDVQNVVKALRDNTRLVWVESPINPTMKVIDIKGLAKAVKGHPCQAILAVDNTFMSPYFQKPLLLGADLSMSSLSKYMNGHTDVVMGSLATNRRDIFDKLKHLEITMGAIPSPFDCFLVNRGLKTLAIRMEQHMKNGLAVANFLEAHPMIRKVLHPGLKSHPQHALAVEQCSGFSGMISFYLDGTGETTKVFNQSLKVFTLTDSLGTVQSLIGIPSLMSHHTLPQEIKDKFGIDDTLVRLSVGIEATEDLIADLGQALDVAKHFEEQKKSTKK